MKGVIVMSGKSDGTDTTGGAVAGLGAEARAVIVACAVRMREIAARPDPPAWRSWEVAELAELREYGPRYLPADWFGGGQPLPEKFRVRYLRTVHELAQEKLVERTATGGRLSHLKLTAAGELVAAALGEPVRPAAPEKKAKKPKGPPRAKGAKAADGVSITDTPPVGDEATPPAPEVPAA